MEVDRESRCPCRSPREIYRFFLTRFFSHLLIIPFGVAFAITRLTYGLVEAYTTLCLIEKHVAILIAAKGFLELMMFWTPLLLFRCCKMVERASRSPCFEIFVYAFTVTELVLLVLEMVWCLGNYSEKKATCPFTDPDWNVHFANFAISQTVIDGMTWIGTIFAVCFFICESDEPDMDDNSWNTLMANFKEGEELTAMMARYYASKPYNLKKTIQIDLDTFEQNYI